MIVKISNYLIHRGSNVKILEPSQIFYVYKSKIKHLTTLKLSLLLKSLFITKNTIITGQFRLESIDKSNQDQAKRLNFI
jgi:hypothetical protein